MSGENKRQATSPAEKEGDLAKRRYTWQDMKISLDSNEFTEKMPEQTDLLHDAGLPTKQADTDPPLDHTSQSTKSPEKVISLDTKVDRITEKMDWLVNFIANSKVETDARNKLNDQKFSRVETAYNSMVDSLAKTSDSLNSCNQKIAQQALTVSSHDAGISSLQTQLRVQRASNDELRSEIQDMSSEFKKFKIEVGEIKRSVLDLGSEVRERKLIISGVPEGKNEDLIDTVLTDLNKVLESAITSSSKNENGQNVNRSRPEFRKLSVQDIDNVYRVGRWTRNSQKIPRNICLSMNNTYLRQMILSARSSMKGMHKNFYISEDLTSDARTLRSNLKLIAASAKNLGFETKISGNKLTIGSDTFAPDELGAISTDITTGSKQEKLVKNGIAFKGDKSVYSNFFPAVFQIEDIEYTSVEQFFQNAKAVECGKLTSARKIMNKVNPWHIKVIGDRVEATESWNKMRMETLYRGIFAKFDQNGPLRRLLLESSGLNLYEATTDLYYACGIGLDSPKWETADWPGENVTGKILMKVREEFAAETSLGHSEGDSIRYLLASDPDESSADNMLIDDDPHLATGPEAMSEPVTKASSTNALPDDRWQTVSDKSARKSYTDALKFRDQQIKNPIDGMSDTKLPHLKRGDPQVTPICGGKSAHCPRKKKQKQKKKFSQQTELTLEEKSFLQSKNKKNKSALTSTPKSKDLWPHSSDLSPTQKNAIICQGLQPDSDFVKNIVASKTSKKK